jgi:hypothetical protein
VRATVIEGKERTTKLIHDELALEPHPMDVLAAMDSTEGHW